MVPRPPKKKKTQTRIGSSRVYNPMWNRWDQLHWGDTQLAMSKCVTLCRFLFFGWVAHVCLSGWIGDFLVAGVLVVCDLFVTLVCGYWWQVVRQTASFTWTTAEATTIVAEATIVGETATKEEQQEEQEQKQEQEQEQQPIQHLSMSLGFVLETFQQNESIHAGIVGSTSRWIQGGENLDETTLNVSWGDGRKPLIFNSSQVPCFGWVSRLPLDL